MADTPLILRKRKIQHPGFEFFETDMSIYKEYEVNTDALVILFASKGPIMEAMSLTNLSDYTLYYGTPETEAEIYFYTGIEAILNAGGTVTAIRLPYMNSVASPKANKLGGVNIFYRALYGNIINSSITNVADIESAYEADVNFKSVELTPAFLTEDDLTEIVGGQGENEFVIVNKYHDFVTNKGEEIFVTVFGAGNVIRHQGLNNEDTPEDFCDDFTIFEITKELGTYESLNGFTYVSDDLASSKLTPTRDSIYWQSSGDMSDELDRVLRVDETFEEDLYDYFPQLTTYTVAGDPSKEGEILAGEVDKTVTFNGSDIALFSQFYYSDTLEITGGLIETLISYSSTNHSGTEIDTSDSGVYPTSGTLDAATMVKVDDTTYRITFSGEDTQAYSLTVQPSYTDEGEILYEDVEFPILDEFGIETGEYTTVSVMSVDTYSYTVAGSVDRDLSEDVSYVDYKKDDFLTIVVSKIKPSLLEANKYDIEILEAFNGSIFSNSVDAISQESDYLGDLINGVSAYISYYGKDANKMSEIYDKDTDTFLVTDQIPYRLSWADGSYQTLYTSTAIDLTKNIYVNSTQESDATWTNYSTNILTPTLNKVKNSIRYTFRDVYDFGLCSILAEANLTNRTYNPTDVDLVSANSSTCSAWKKNAKSIEKFCQNKHKLSMAHINGPRKLVLNGNLSRIDDLKEDPLDNTYGTFRPQTIQKVSIKDTTYLETNVQWIEVYDSFNKNKMWMPINVQLAGNITYNDINRNVWDAPAGHNYGVVSGIYRLAFNPEYELKDRLYLNCLNYAVSWPTGVTTIEGQKTGYSENSALNRINVRRLLIWMERYAQNIAPTYMYEINNQSTRDNFKAELDTEYGRIKALGGLSDYEVQCDEENNSATVIDNSELRFAVKIIPARTAEYIIGNFIICKTGTDLTEVSGVF